MAGASERTQRVAYVNANWAAGDDGDGGTFDLQVVTTDGSRHAVRVAAGDMAAVVAMTQASSVMLWDPEGRTLIAANLAGDWIQRSWAAGDERQVGRPH